MNPRSAIIPEVGMQQMMGLYMVVLVNCITKVDKGGFREPIIHRGGQGKDRGRRKRVFLCQLVPSMKGCIEAGLHKMH